MAKAKDKVAPAVTGRCYCGATTFVATQRPQTIAYCHCTDCRRVTGAPVAAFAAFDDASMTFTPDEGRSVVANPGVTRSFCAACGSPLTGRYAYLPGQVFVPIGILDQADDLAPHFHAHESQRLTWLHINDDLERFATTSRSSLAEAAT